LFDLPQPILVKKLAFSFLVWKMLDFGSGGTQGLAMTMPLCIEFVGDVYHMTSRGNARQH